MRGILTYLPEWSKQYLIRIRSALLSVAYYGKGRYCPVCGNSSRRFIKHRSREEAKCPRCGAMERHRFSWIYLTRKTRLFIDKQTKMLHVAPERCFEPRFRECLGSNYITADLSNPRAMVKMDITDIQYPDCSFDIIYCSHVLEHVQEDRRAMKEIYRVLKEGGWALLLVPITAEATIEDPSVVDPSERLKLFGQEDHVRRYGPDYVYRLRDAGFKVKVVEVKDLIEEKEAIRMGLSLTSGKIFYCQK